jgi:signal transduction histidine kinase
MRLQQIFVNLIGNSLKFSEHGKIAVRIKLDKKSGNIVTLIMEVEDEGIGISKEKHKTIFEPFNQLGDPLTSKYGGTGLGLSIARRLVEMMNGEMGLASELGKGSKFYFTVDLQLPE